MQPHPLQLPHYMLTFQGHETLQIYLFNSAVLVVAFWLSKVLDLSCSKRWPTGGVASSRTRPLTPLVGKFSKSKVSPKSFNLEIFLNLQGSEFIQTLLLIYNHLAKFVVYKSWTRSALLKGTSKCFLVSSITCRNEEAIEWVWFEYKLSFVVKLSTKPHPQTGSLH